MGYTLANRNSQSKDCIKTTLRTQPFRVIIRKAISYCRTVLDEDYNDLLSYSLEAGLIHKLLNEYTNHILPKPDLTTTENPLHVNPGDMVYLRDWKSNTSGDLNPKWKGPYWVILCIPTVVKLEGHASWAHISRIKPVPPSQETNEQTNVLLTPVNS